jgi:hypothetical protein
MKLKTIIIALFALNISTAEASYAVASVKITECPENAITMKPISVVSNHAYYIMNDTLVHQLFIMKYMVCPADQLMNCHSKVEQLGLAPGQHYTKNIVMNQKFYFAQQKSHRIYATTEISGGSQSSAIDEKYVTTYYQ